MDNRLVFVGLKDGLAVVAPISRSVMQSSVAFIWFAWISGLENHPLAIFVFLQDRLDITKISTRYMPSSSVS